MRRPKIRLERMRLSRPGWRYLHLNRDALEVNESSIARSQAKGHSAIPPRILEYSAIAIGMTLPIPSSSGMLPLQHDNVWFVS